MSFPSDLMILANKAAEEDESLPSKKATFFYYDSEENFVPSY